MQLQCSEGCSMSLHSPACWRALEKEMKRQDAGFALKVRKLDLTDLHAIVHRQLHSCVLQCSGSSPLE